MQGLPTWAKVALGVLAALVVLYVLGFVVYGCGSETADPVTP